MLLPSPLLPIHPPPLHQPPSPLPRRRRSLRRVPHARILRVRAVLRPHLLFPSPLVSTAARPPPPPHPKTPPHPPFRRRTPFLLEAPPPLACTWLPQVMPPLLPPQICRFSLREQGQWQSPAKSTHIPQAGNIRTPGMDVKCLTAVGEPQVQ